MNRDNKLNKASSLLCRLMLMAYLGVAALAVLSSIKTCVVYIGMRFLLMSLLLLAVGGLLWWLCTRPCGFLRNIGAARVGVALTLICLGINLAWVLCVRAEPQGDYLCFYNGACDIADCGKLLNAGYIAAFPHIAGYCSFLSVFFRLFGCSALVSAVVNASLATLTGLLIYLLCLRVADLESAVFAFLLWILCPSKTIFNALVFSDALYTCLGMLFFFLLYETESKGKRSIGFGIAAGVVLGLLLCAINAVRPISAILLIAYFLWLLLLRGDAVTDRKEWKMWLPLTLVMLLCYILAGKAWDAHMEKLLGEEPASSPVYSLYVGMNMDTLGTYNADDMDLMFAYKSEGMSAEEAQRALIPHLKERISSENFKIIWLVKEKMRGFLGSDDCAAISAGAWLSPKLKAFAIGASNVYFYALLTAVFIGGCAMLIRPVKNSVLMLPLYFIGLSLAHMLVETSGRYHYSLIPVMVVIAALFPHRLRKNREIP